MVDVAFCTYVLVSSPDGPLPPVTSVPVAPKPGSAAARQRKAHVASPFPGYLLGWYGSTTLEQISEARRAAAKANRTLYRVDVTVDGGDYAPSKQRLDHLKRLGVVHLDLLPAETDEFVRAQLAIPDKVTISDYVWAHPSKLSALWKLRRFAHISAAIFSARANDQPVYYGAIHPKRIKEMRVLRYPQVARLKLDV